MFEPRSGYDDTRNDCKCSVEESCDLCTSEREAAAEPHTESPDEFAKEDR